MKALRRYATIATVFLFLADLFFFSADFTMAKGPFDRVTVSGGLIENEVEVSDPLLMDFFSLSILHNAGIEQPQVEGEGYLVIRYFKDENGSFTAWDSLRFYPSNEESGGYVYYEGLVNGSSEYDGNWYLASYTGSSRLRQIINVSEQPLPPTKTILTQLLYLAAALAGFAIVVTVGLYVLRPTIYQSST